VRIGREIWWLSAAFVAITAFTAAHGYAEGNRPDAIIVELKPLAYFPMIFFFVIAIRTREDAKLAATIFVAGGVIMAVLYLGTIAAVRLGFVDELNLFEFLHRSDEFIFRGYPIIGFLYKGAFYIVIAAIFLLVDPFRWTKLLGALTVIATAMTLTRGLSLALLGCIIAAIVLGRQWHRAPMYVTQAALLIAVGLVASSFDTSYEPPDAQSIVASAEAHAASPNTVSERAAALSGEIAAATVSPLLRPTDNGRIADIKFVLSHLDVPTVLAGRGLGEPIGDRDRIELNYLEIFYKQGIFGLMFWGAIFLYLSWLYRRTPQETKQFALAFYLGGMFVFVANVTNPFLPGSIGMAAVFVALAALSVLSHEPRREMQARDWYGLRS